MNPGTAAHQYSPRGTSPVCQMHLFDMRCFSFHTQAFLTYFISLVPCVGHWLPCFADLVGGGVHILCARCGTILDTDGKKPGRKQPNPWVGIEPSHWCTPLWPQRNIRNMPEGIFVTHTRRFHDAQKPPYQHFLCDWSLTWFSHSPDIAELLEEDPGLRAQGGGQRWWQTGLKTFQQKWDSLAGS